MALQDKIGREEIINKVCGLVDALQKDQNFCLSINGAWGSGKSFVLQMIEEQLSKKQENVIVKYDAWNNSFYSDPLIAILSCIIDGVDEKLYIVEQYEKKIKNAARTTANTLAKVSSKIKTLKDVIVGIKEIIHTFHNPIDMKVANDFKSYQKLLRETKEVLNEITQRGEYREKQTKLVVLVDEIDRCLPDEQLKILERLHHVLDIQNCAVIVAMNQNCIAKTVQTLYGIDGYEYLRKFFDFSYLLNTSSDEYLRKLLAELSENVSKINNKTDLETAISIAFQCLCFAKHKEIIKSDEGTSTVYTYLLSHIDNREIFRYYGALLRICNDFGWEKLKNTYIFFIIIGLFIRKNISSTFLNESVIKWKQNKLNDEKGKRDFDSRDMPYFDYIKEYLVIDRQNLPDEFQGYSGYHTSSVAALSWYFNEIVYYSISTKQYEYNQMRRFQAQQPIIVDDFKELRRLIILYGGEQERNATNER